MKKYFCLLLSLLMLSGLPGCASRTELQAPAGFQPALDKNTGGQIRVVGNYNNFEALEAIFEKFGTYYPNVDMSYTKLDDYSNVIGMVLNGSDAPNIYATYSWMVGREVYAAALESAEDLADPSLGLDLSILRPNILTKTEDDKLYMVPVFATTHGMLVNKDLFEKEGLEIPKTYPELISVCASLREKGYRSPVMGYALDNVNYFLFSLVFPYFCGGIADDAAAVAQLNALDPAAGEYMRPALTLAMDFLNNGCADKAVCQELDNNYNSVILRFLDGDVPMMICNGDTVSGTKKRESQSEAFTAHPFSYYFMPIPITEDGGYFLDSPSLEFSVNKNCENLDITNEFMRFLVTSQRLNEMAEIKRLVSPTTDLSFDSIYAPFGEVPGERIISPEEFGLMDDAVVQFRLALYSVGTGAMSIDEAVSAYGTFQK